MKLPELFLLTALAMLLFLLLAGAFVFRKWLTGRGTRAERAAAEDMSDLMLMGMLGVRSSDDPL